ncbi:MAG: hypothetical protein N2442_06165 [Spirochaetes bacterium]|nr:hypothetical protein [Spirochaetota bacterium]
MKWWCVLLVLPVLAASCTSSRGKIVQDRLLRKGYEETVKAGVVRIQKVSVSRSFDEEKIAENSRYILNLLFQKRNEHTVASSTLSLEVALKEDSFIRDFRTWNTVTVELSIFHHTTPVFTGLYSEESDSSLSSYSYLYDLLERATREVR